MAVDQHSIFLNIKGVARIGESYLDGRRVGFIQRPEGSLSYIPPGCTWSGWDEGDQTASFLLISVERDFVHSLFEKMPRAGPLRPDLGFKDLSIQFAARKIASELKQDDPASGLMVESHVSAMFAQLLRRSNITHKISKGGLAPTVLKRIVDKINLSTDQAITLTELSEDAGLSLFHFCRAFKQSTGHSPHAYLNRSRLQRVSDLLRTTDISITEIALACGYSSASHMSTSFNRQLGVPPIAYRKAWRE
ncbi:AraC family transcriptional regulator [Pararhizobium sp. A13]|uniref:AraC family transcriptional regulator n=1 Tax=Pararhizobium sp. A13 TaxID=3133975 RepID=UPI00311B2C05